jgi:hypothetical protein
MKGWKLVPKNLNLQMRMAAKRAMKEYIDRMPDEARAKMPRSEYGGVRVATNLKYDLRYAAAVRAAPISPIEQTFAELDSYLRSNETREGKFAELWGTLRNLIVDD